MALLHTYTFNSAQKVLRIDTDKISGVKRDFQAIGIHLICTSVTGGGDMDIELGNTDAKADSVAAVYVNPSDGSTTAISQTLATGSNNYYVSYFGADAARYVYLKFDASLSGGTCAIHANYEFEVSDES